jgi:hypothetical protein
MSNTFSRSKKESLKDQIDKLDTIEHRQIYNIIKGYQPQTTKVQNGVLVSTDSLNDSCLQEIEKYVSFCLDQRKRIDEDTKARKTYERMNA